MSGTPGAKRRSRRVRSILSWLFILALAAGWAAFLRPASMGGPAGYVIVSGESMEPMMHTGDLAIVRHQDSYEVGDVVAYRIPKSDIGGGMLVIHRVVGGDAQAGFVLQGDNRDTQDIWRPAGSDVVGALRWHVPHAGTALFLLKTPMVIAGVIGFLGFWFVVTWGDDTSHQDTAAEEAVPEAVVEPAADPAPVGPRRAYERPQHRRLSPGTAAAAGVVLISVVAARRVPDRPRRVARPA